MNYLATFLTLLFGSYICADSLDTSGSTEKRQNLSDSDSTYVGCVDAIVVDHKGYIVSINETDGVYLSSNNGESWKRIGRSYLLTSTTCLAVDKRGRLLVGVWAKGIMEFSPSNGRWHRIDTLRNDPWVTSLAVNWNNHIFAGGNSRIYRSTDNGAQWTKLGLEDYQSRPITIDNDGILYAETSEGYMTSRDNGDSWTKVNLPLDLSVYSTAFDSNGTIYLGTWTSGIYVSRDQGRTWKCTFGIDTTKVSVNSILVYKDKKVFAGLESGEILVSLNAGETWSRTSFFQVNKSAVRCLTSNHRGFIFVGTCGSGVYRSTDSGTTWEQVNRGFINVNPGG